VTLYPSPGPLVPTAADITQWWRLRASLATLLMFAPAGFALALRSRRGLPRRFPRAIRARLLSALDRLDHELPGLAAGAHSAEAMAETERRVAALVAEIDAIRLQTLSHFRICGTDAWDSGGDALERDAHGFSLRAAVRRIPIPPERPEAAPCGDGAA